MRKGGKRTDIEQKKEGQTGSGRGEGAAQQECCTFGLSLSLSVCVAMYANEKQLKRPDESL